ncbi:hypothetical protein [Serratia quinivorans]
MSNVITKKSIVEAANVVTSELQEKANAAQQTFDTRFNAGQDTKADKKLLQAANTKLHYFINNVVKAVNDDKLSGVFYYAIKNAKQAPETFFREAMENSYSLEKLVYLVESIKNKRCVYSLADQSGSRVFAIVEVIRDEMGVITNGNIKKLMDEAKKANDKDADQTYTQANQLISLCERLGILEKMKGYGVAKNGSQQYKVIENDFVNYIRDSIPA